jgi:hypothetical protein
MNITKNLGMLLLAIYLILAGITLLFHITIPTIIMGILALAAGILISSANRDASHSHSPRLRYKPANNGDSAKQSPADASQGTPRNGILFL